MLKIVRGVVSLALVLSGLLGARILAYDKWLWSAEPSHAYGLLGFVLADLVLAALLLRRVRFTMIGASVMATVQFGAMLADALAGQPMGVPSSAFRSYLLNDVSYLGLLVVQVAILFVSTGALAIPLMHRHGHSRQFLRLQWR